MTMHDVNPRASANLTGYFFAASMTRMRMGFE